MIAWFVNNLGTIIAMIILAVIIGAALYKVVKDKKKGTCSCGCDCGSCGAACCCKKE